MTRSEPQNQSDLQPLLELESVSKSFGRPRIVVSRNSVVPAVDDVSLTVSAGESLALVGESGSGKTTLARMATGLVEPTSGVVRYGGEDINASHSRADHRQLRRRVQMVFQDPRASISSRLPVWRIVSEGWQAHPDIRPPRPRERVVELLAMVGMGPAFADKYSHELSGGQRQRIGIARALALEPDLIVCDEPLSALDVSIQAQVVNLFRSLQRELGLAFLFITHDLSLVRYVADTVAVMRQGRILETGLVSEVFTQPASDYTALLLASVATTSMARGGRSQDTPALETAAGQHES